jgi:DNA-binding PadR family transcriptional regulator
MDKHYNQLPQVAFCILLALGLKERHGYEIIKQAEQDSNGKIHLGPGALYTSIKQLRKRELIVEVSRPDDTKRRYYKLTGEGSKILEEELEYYRTALELAKERRLVGGNYAQHYA